MEIKKWNWIDNNLFVGNNIDVSAFFEQKRLREEEKLKIFEEEQKRVNNITCPLCKSKEKKLYNKYESNGVYGPGYCSYLLDSYIICLNCGIIYKDLEKINK